MATTQTKTPIGTRDAAAKAAPAILLLLSLAICFGEGWLRAPAAMDFYGYYGPARVWLGGENPYDRGLFTRRVAQFFPANAVGETACPLLPSALTIFAPLALLAPPAAARAMWLISFAALLLALLAMRELWARDCRPEEQQFVAALLLQSRLIQSVAYRGQPSLLMLACVLGAFVASRRGAYWLAGAAAAFTSAKFTLMLPLLAFWAWQRSWRPLLWTLVFGTAASLPPLFSVGPEAFARGFLDSLAFIADYNVVHGDPFHVISLRAIVGLWPLSEPVARALCALCALLAFGFLWRRMRASSAELESWIFAGFTALGLIGMYHRVYDAVLLLPVAVLAWRALRDADGRWRSADVVLALALAMVLFVFAPQSVAQRSADWLARHGALAFLQPLNAWLCLTVMLCILRIVRRADPRPAVGMPRR